MSKLLSNKMKLKDSRLEKIVEGFDDKTGKDLIGYFSRVAEENNMYVDVTDVEHFYFDNRYPSVKRLTFFTKGRIFMVGRFYTYLDEKMTYNSVNFKLEPLTNEKKAEKAFDVFYRSMEKAEISDSSRNT
jgi:hypothetical protein